jgi:hypothetical protein
MTEAKALHHDLLSVVVRQLLRFLTKCCSILLSTMIALPLSCKEVASTEDLPTTLTGNPNYFQVRHWRMNATTTSDERMENPYDA